MKLRPVSKRTPQSSHLKILLSGGSRGLGLGIIQTVLKEGHLVQTMARQPTTEVKVLQKQYPDQFHFLTGDFTQVEDLKRFTQNAEEFDILINNVGTGFDGILATQSIESIDYLLNLNLKSALLCSKFFIRARLTLGPATHGNIINISSIIGIRGYAGLAAYSATKAGLLGMTRGLAREMGSKGFRVNAVLPGYLETELSASLSKNQLDQIKRRTPLGRLGTVADVVPLIQFLMSDESRFITGQEFVVDGGITC